MAFARPSGDSLFFNFEFATQITYVTVNAELVSKRILLILSSPEDLSSNLCRA